METKKFAWLPKKVTSGKSVWLNFYYEHRNLYDVTTGRPPLNSLYYSWSETVKERKFRDMKERIIQNRNVWNDVILTKKDIQ